MQKVFKEVNSLDKKCYEQYGLSEDILMEHAAISMLNFIENKFKENSKILIVCGSGNNGADGITLARLLQYKYKVKLYIPFDVKSDMAKLQLNRTNLIGVEIIKKYSLAENYYSLIVDCLFGSGLSRPLNEQSIKIIKQLNKIDCYKLSCDIPSGINIYGQIVPICFKANTTITMGALKKSLFTDSVKEYVGNIKVANLGVQRELYESKTNYFLLDKKDLILPIRKNKISHKGTFGHLAVIIGDKKGAGILASKAAFSFGCGLVSIISKKNINKIPNEIMQSTNLPLNTSAICIGMGLGKKYSKKILKNHLPKVIDADLFYDKNILSILLNQDNIILTPHPKEFCSLLKISKIADINIDELQNNRFKYIKMFNKKYSNIVLLLKGGNVLIAYKDNIYINTFGTSVLSKGGSGDILTGLIGSLLAQGYNLLDATISGSLAHTIGALNYKGNNYSFTPKQFIKQIKIL
jgi:ADP-dependent NAD(P)H-hydrate dehydratase / NAD(P)H-hydrate epimerase